MIVRMKLGGVIQLQLYLAKSQYWLHKAGTSHEHLILIDLKMLEVYIPTLETTIFV